MKRLLALLLALFAAGPAFAQSPGASCRPTTCAPSFWPTSRRSSRASRSGSACARPSGRSGTPTGRTRANRACRPRSPGPCRTASRPSPSSGRRRIVFDIGGVINYGFKDEAVLLVRITPPADLASGTLKLAAEANWLVCEDVCIPEDGKFELTLPVTAAGAPAPPATRAIFDKARQQRADAEPVARALRRRQVGRSDADRRGQGPEGRHHPRRLFLPGRVGTRSPAWPSRAPAIGADGIRIPLKRGDAKAALPAELAGTLVLTEKTADGEVKQAFDVVGQARSRLRADHRRWPRGGQRAALAGRGAAVRPAGRPDPEPDALRVPGARHEGRGLRATGRP